MTWPLGRCPSETLERLRALGDRAQWIRGNADRELTRGEEGLAPEDVLDWVRDRLSDEQIGFLHGLPERVELDVDGLGRVLFCHASPRNDVDIFLEGTPRNAWRRSSPASRRASRSAVTRTCSSRATSAASASSTPAVWASPYEDEPGAYWALLGPESSTGARSTTIRRWQAREFPSPYFQGERPSRAEVTELFGTLAVGA